MAGDRANHAAVSSVFDPLDVAGVLLARGRKFNHFGDFFRLQMILPVVHVADLKRQSGENQLTFIVDMKIAQM